MRVLLLAVGAIAIVVGLVFAGQGAGLIQGSFMTGARSWLAIGIVLVVVGAVLIATGLRRRPTR